MTGPDEREGAFDELVAPHHTALVTVELQEGVVGENSLVPELARAAEPILAGVGDLVRTARGAGVQVVHCTVDARADGRGANHNTPLLAAMAKRAGPRRAGGKVHKAKVHPLVGADDSDLVMGRLHGLSPMTGTSLDPVLRNLGVSTIVATGVSINVALLGLCFEAVNSGYRLVVPRDAVAGVDDAYVDAVFTHTLRMLATVTTANRLLQAWKESP